jgi:hypothetical protein
MFRLRNHHLTVIFCWLFLIVFILPAHAATDVEQAQKNVDIAIDTLQETQEQEDGWADEKASLITRLKEKRLQQELLSKQQERLRKQVALMQERVTESKRRVEEVERIRLEMRSFLDETFLRLYEQINSELLPFLVEERQKRLERLEGLLLDDAVSTAEKFRRLMEALQIEADYGRGMEVVREPVRLGQESLIMDVLRIGRLSLFSRTPDGTHIAVFDQAAGSWQTLPQSYNRDLRHAIEVANKTRPVEIVRLPLGRIDGSDEIKVTQ